VQKVFAHDRDRSPSSPGKTKRLAICAIAYTAGSVRLELSYIQQNYPVFHCFVTWGRETNCNLRAYSNWNCLKEWTSMSTCRWWLSYTISYATWLSKYDHSFSGQYPFLIVLSLIKWRRAFLLLIIPWNRLIFSTASSFTQILVILKLLLVKRLVQPHVDGDGPPMTLFQNLLSSDLKQFAVQFRLQLDRVQFDRWCLWSQENTEVPPYWKWNQYLKRFLDFI